jgi:hypothetical protein
MASACVGNNSSERILHFSNAAPAVDELRLIRRLQIDRDLSYDKLIKCWVLRAVSWAARAEKTLQHQ